MIINIIVININIILFQSIQSYSGNKHKIKVQKITVKPQHKSGNSKNMFKEKDFFFWKSEGNSYIARPDLCNHEISHVIGNYS